MYIFIHNVFQQKYWSDSMIVNFFTTLGINWPWRYFKFNSYFIAIF